MAHPSAPAESVQPPTDTPASAAPTAPAKATAKTPAKAKASRVSQSAPVAKAAKPVKAVKPAKAVKTVKPAKPVKPPKAEEVKPVKVKLVRDTFTFPEDEYAQLASLKKRALALGVEAKKGELVRAGLSLLSATSDDALRAALDLLVRLKTGRPKK